MSKTLQLNISERLAAVGILNQFKGNLDKLALVLEDIKQLPINEEEWAKAERKITPPTEPGGDTVWNWDNDKAGDKEVTLHDTVVEHLKTEIEARDKRGEFALSDKAFITLFTKLKA